MGREEIVGRYMARCYGEEHKIPAFHLSWHHSAFAKFRKIDGLSSRITVDLAILNIEATLRPNAYKLRKRHAENHIIGARKVGSPRREREFVNARNAIRVASGLRWGGAFLIPTRLQ